VRSDGRAYRRAWRSRRTRAALPHAQGTVQRGPRRSGPATLSDSYSGDAPAVPDTPLWRD